MGAGWNNEKWTDGRDFPDRTELDEIVPDRPVFLAGWDAHAAWVNKSALDIAKYTKDTQDPPGGVIGRFENGEPNGLLKEFAAMDPVLALVAQDRDLKDDLIKIIDEAARCGLTSFGEVYPFGYGCIDERRMIETFKELEDAGKLKCRYHIFTELKDDLSAARAFRREIRSSKLRMAGLKLLADGSYEGHTAYSLESYANDPGFYGSLLYDPVRLRDAVVNADREGFAVRLHAIGSATVRSALDCYEAALKANGNKGIHHSIEHAETVSERDIKRFAELGVTASMQPLHCLFSIDIYEEMTGPKQKPYYPVKRLLDNNAVLAYGTDYPIIPDLRPMDGIYTAITRTTKEGYPEGGFEPSQKISLAQALQAYTKGAAIAENFDARIGTLEAGKLADMVILDKNLFAATPEEILETEVLLTIMDGEITYKNDKYSFGEELSGHRRQARCAR
jgi:predicted amidohydrolase YtcJ